MSDKPIPPTRATAPSISLQEAAQRIAAPQEDAPPPEDVEEQELLDDAQEHEEAAHDVDPDGDPVPEWAIIPEGLVIPTGVPVGYMMFRSGWTRAPQLGDRQVIMWNLTMAEEKLALKRTRGDVTQISTEFAMMSIRVIDGHKADWTGKRGGPGDVRKFMDEIGSACRDMIKNFYLRTATLTDEQKIDFFTNCLAVRNSR